MRIRVKGKEGGAMVKFMLKMWIRLVVLFYILDDDFAKKTTTEETDHF